MSKDAVNALLSEFSPTEDKLSRSVILSLLRTRITSGLEASDRGDETEPYWDEINRDLESITKDPREAFRFAVETLSLIQPSDDPDQFRSWLKGNALVILSTPNVRPFLVEDLNQGDISKLHEPLESILRFDIPESVKTNNDLSQYPQCFNLVMGMLVVRSLSNDMPSVSDLHDKTEQLLGNQRVRDVINLFHEVTADSEIVEPLYQAIQ